MSGSPAPADAMHRYCVYGLTIWSDLPLALPSHADGSLASVTLRAAPEAYFDERIEGVAFQPDSDDWYQYAFLPDGTTYVRWGDVGEFLVSAGGEEIRCRRDEAASFESFQVYVLGQALSFALVQLGLEPLHSTTVVVRDQAVAFLGDSGYGKSSLAAAFIAAGHRVLTDDLLLVRIQDGAPMAYPGPARLKLFPEIAERFLGNVSERVPLNEGADKLILPIDARSCHPSPVALGAVHLLNVPWLGSPPQAISITPLSHREALVELVKNAFNRRLLSKGRLQRQLEAMAALANVVPVSTLAYPRELARLPQVLEAIEANLAGGRA